MLKTPKAVVIYLGIGEAHKKIKQHMFWTAVHKYYPGQIMLTGIPLCVIPWVAGETELQRNLHKSVHVSCFTKNDRTTKTVSLYEQEYWKYSLPCEGVVFNKSVLPKKVTSAKQETVAQPKYADMFRKFCRSASAVYCISFFHPTERSICSRSSSKVLKLSSIVGTIVFKTCTLVHIWHRVLGMWALDKYIV